MKRLAFAIAFLMAYIPLYWFDFFCARQEPTFDLSEIQAGTFVRNPLLHGAKGDGKTDDWAVIQRCVNEVGWAGSHGKPGFVYFSSCTFMVSRSIGVGSNTNLRGTPDTSIFRLGAIFTANNARNCSFRGLTIDRTES